MTPEGAHADASDDAAEWAARAASFGAVAEDYDRHRPGYPAELFRDVLALVADDFGGTPRVLDAGAGTGRASVGLARAGARVLAVEPDPAMAAVARERSAGLDVEVLEAGFESCDPAPGSIDLVTAAQAWHWVDPVAGPAVAARALRPGGALAVWWNRPGELSGPVWAAVHDAYAREAPPLKRRERPSQHLVHAVGDEDAAPGFGPWTDVAYAWSTAYTAAGYAALVATYSDHLRLEPTMRARLLAAIRDAIVEVGGGVVEYPYRTILRWARPA